MCYIPGNWVPSDLSPSFSINFSPVHKGLAFINNQVLQLEASEEDTDNLLNNTRHHFPSTSADWRTGQGFILN